MCVVFVGCRTTIPKKSDASAIDSDISLDGEDESAQTPSALWSPGQREANAMYYYLVGEYLATKGDTQKSLALMQASYNLTPNPFLGAKLVAMQTAVGQLDQAFPQAQKLTLLYPKSADNRFLYATLLARKGEFKKAVEECEKAIAIDSKNDKFYLLIVEIYGSQKDYEKAKAAARNMVKALPGSAVGWLELAKLNIITQSKQPALEAARKAYDLQTQHPETVIIYALALELNGKSKEAIQLYEQLYRLNPTNEELIARMIQIYRELGDLRDALDLLDELSATSTEKRPGLQLQRAFILWELKRSEEASKILDDLSRATPDSDRLLFFSGLGHERLQHFDKALAIYLSIPDSSELKIEASVRAAVILKEQKKNEEAMKLIHQSKGDPKATWELYELGGSILSDMEKYDEAIEFLREGNEKFADKPRLLFLIGIYQERSGDVQASMRTMREVIKRDPTNSSAFNYLGYLYAERGENLEEAEKLISKALELKPNDGYYLDSLGWVYFQRNQLDKARETLEKALKQAPDEGVIFEHLGDVAEGEKKLPQAKEYYEKALATKLDKRDKERIEKKLATFLNKYPNLKKTK